ncbi:riboflavin kinase [Ascosphaera apis ARSEF 7405]|uniref:Riboflavin kinase n=1 Tax=Ascosphaera apis ARSEF 7405 TaxID=392613 RepID=A0A168CYB8_9EURO|nr:riboflavin kinase [Ascosphaera apis ARSEF 7405]
MRPDTPRPLVAGPDDGPAPPFPITLFGPVIKGFGRGSKELGVPTANIPPETLEKYPDLPTGVYYGVAALDPQKFHHHSSVTVFPCVLSIGYNPFYKNTLKSIEVHIMRPIDTTSSDSTPSSFFQLPDFYSTPMNLLILGFIRPEYDYVSKEALIDDIKTDCAVAVRSLQRPAYQKYFKQAIETAGFSSEIESQSDSQSKERL